MQKTLHFITTTLKRMLIYFENKILVNQVKENEALLTLAPKIITDKNELQKITPYLTSLKKAISTNGINNIALTGSYGSGKSTIIKTFQYYNPEYHYLNISLASFKDNNGSPEEKEFERKLEVSILQQMFYHVKPSDIPDSRFKRIINLTDGKLRVQAVVFLLWFVSVIILFKFDFIDKLNPLSWALKYTIDWFALTSICVFFFGVGLFIKSIVRILSNSKINKLNVKGELEFGEAVDKSVFNQHLEEILYFFERTKFNIVIIEDVDRFNSTDIFTKLREINILINNSNLISREVKFIYAIKDEMFSDKSDRVKFFEFIIPVIPFINPSNAGEQLTKLINSAQLQGVLSKEFTEDVITFIDDIDMRLLINIFHEYQIYKESLSSDLEQDNLFAIIVYKNMYPEDFGELPKRNGKLYKFLSSRNKYVESLVNKINDQVISIENKALVIENEIDRPIKELRAIYINKLVSKLKNFSCFFINKDISITEALEDENFDVIKKSDKVSYKFWKLFSHNYNQHTLSEETISGVKFSEIESEISKTLTYNQREKNLLSKINNELNKLKGEKEILKNKISEVESLSLKEIFELVEIDGYLDTFKDNYLMRNLLLNGYINENYNDYISLFHEVNLTKEDFAFERKVKSGLLTPFDYQLQKTENLLKKLPNKYFKREVILNYDILDCLLKNKVKYLAKYENYFQLLSIENIKNFEFTVNYIHRVPENLADFINTLIKYKRTFWDYLIHKSNFPDSKIRELVTLIFEYAESTDITKLKEIETLVNYFEEMDYFFKFSSSLKNTAKLKYFLLEKTLQIKQLDVPDNHSAGLFEYVYENNSYEINIHNIDVILEARGINFDDNKLNRAHYTTLLETGLQNLLDYISDNIEFYIEKVLLKLPDNKDEDEDTIISLLNREDISLTLKSQFIEIQNKSVSKLTDINEIGIMEMLLANKKIIPIWENVFDYYDSLEEKTINKVLIDFLNAKSNNLSLTQIKLNSGGDREKEFYENFSNLLVYCGDLTFETYTNLLKSVPYVYTDIDHSKLSEEKIDWMTTNRFLSLTIENFKGIKENFHNFQIKIIEAYQKEFLEKYTEFHLDADDWYLLFKSSKFSQSNKIEIIQKMDDSIIIQNAKIADIVCDLLPVDKYVSLRYEVLEAMFNTNSSVQKRIVLLNFHFDNLDNGQVQALTEKLGADYAKIFMKQHKPVFANNKLNFDFFTNLQKRDLIIRHEFVDKTDEIRVIANY